MFVHLSLWQQLFQTMHLIFVPYAADQYLLSNCLGLQSQSIGWRQGQAPCVGTGACSVCLQAVALSAGTEEQPQCHGRPEGRY